MLDFDVLRSVALVLAVVGQALFVLFYASLPWHKSHIGRALFFKALSLLALLALGTLGRLTGQPAPDSVFTLLYVAMCAGIWWQVASFLRVFFGEGDIGD